MINNYGINTASLEYNKNNQEINKAFKVQCEELATNFKLEKHELNNHSFTKCEVAIKPDFVSKYLVMKCKYSKHSRLYGSDIEQMINHIALFDNENKSVEFLFVVINEINQICYVNARELCSFYTKGEFLLSHQFIYSDNRFKGIKVNSIEQEKSSFPIDFVSKTTKIRTGIRLKDIFSINANTYYNQVT